MEEVNNSSMEIAVRSSYLLSRISLSVALLSVITLHCFTRDDCEMAQCSYHTMQASYAGLLLKCSDFRFHLYVAKRDTDTSMAPSEQYPRGHCACSLRLQSQVMGTLVMCLHALFYNFTLSAFFITFCVYKQKELRRTNHPFFSYTTRAAQETIRLNNPFSIACVFVAAVTFFKEPLCSNCRKDTHTNTQTDGTDL